MTRHDPQVNFRLADDLREQLRIGARAAGRSLTAHMTHLLRAGVAGSVAAEQDLPYHADIAAELARALADLPGKPPVARAIAAMSLALVDENERLKADARDREVVSPAAWNQNRIALAARLDAIGEILSQRYPTLVQAHHDHLASVMGAGPCASPPAWLPIDQAPRIHEEKLVLWIEREEGVEGGAEGLVEGWWDNDLCDHGAWTAMPDLAGEPTHFMRIAPPAVRGGDDTRADPAQTDIDGGQS